MDDTIDFFLERRRRRQERRAARLASTDDTGWSKHTVHHWYLMIDGKKLDYWPSSNKWQFDGQWYRGGLPRWLSDKIKEQLDATR